MAVARRNIVFQVVRDVQDDLDRAVELLEDHDASMREIEVLLSEIVDLVGVARSELYQNDELHKPMQFVIKGGKR